MKDIEIIIQTICSNSGISVNAIKSQKRNRNLADTRKIISYLLKKNTTLPLSQIGMLLNRNHSTITHHINGTENLIQTDKIFAQRVKFLENILEPVFTKTRTKRYKCETCGQPLKD